MKAIVLSETIEVALITLRNCLEKYFRGEIEFVHRTIKAHPTNSKIHSFITIKGIAKISKSGLYSQGSCHNFISEIATEKTESKIGAGIVAYTVNGVRIM